MINTSFRRSNGEVVSEVFETFEKNLLIIQNRISRANNLEQYDTTSQDVVIPAFIAAYTGKSAETTNLSHFPKTPLPNWRVDYTGLNKIKFFSDLFQSITLSHAYQSTYSVVGYTSSIQYSNSDTVGLHRPIEDYNNGVFGNIRNEQGDLVPIYVIGQVTMSEQFSPLIGVNFRTKSRVSARIEYKTKRDLALTVTNAQITEAIAKDVALELGYTKNNLRLPFRSQGRLIVLKNDVTFRLNFTVSDTRTIQRKIDDLNVITAGNINYQFRPNISYAVNQKLQIQMYFERTINEPQISNAFRRATSRFGAQIRFNLAQ